jgi:putative transposon-encoded protein
MENQISVEKPMIVEIEGYEAIEKIVKSGGNSGRVYVPVNWLNCRVKVIRLNPISERPLPAKTKRKKGASVKI